MSDINLIRQFIRLSPNSLGKSASLCAVERLEARFAELETGLREGIETIKEGSAIRALPILETALYR